MWLYLSIIYVIMLCLYKDLNGHWNETEDEPWLHHEFATSKKV